MDIETIAAYVVCFSPIALLVGLSVWLVWRDKDMLD
jgi:hypothetical protein